MLWDITWSHLSSQPCMWRESHYSLPSLHSCLLSSWWTYSYICYPACFLINKQFLNSFAWLIAQSLENLCFGSPLWTLIELQGSLVIASFWKGRSHNPSCNKCILRISSSLAASNLTIEPSYIQSVFNRADSLSRGILGTPDSHLNPTMVIPDPLKCFLEPL